MKKSNKTIAGYHLLMLLSTIDNQFDGRADEVIREYLSEEAPFKLNLDKELEEIIELDNEKTEEFFITKASDFYEDSEEIERQQFLEFAKTLIRADEEITREENSFYRLLMRTWRDKSKEQK